MHQVENEENGKNLEGPVGIHYTRVDMKMACESHRQLENKASSLRRERASGHDRRAEIVYSTNGGRPKLFEKGLRSKLR